MATTGISAIPPVPQTVKDPALRVYLQALQTTVSFLSGQKNQVDALTLISGLRSELNALSLITVANNVDSATISAIETELAALAVLIETTMSDHESEYHAHRYRTLATTLYGDDRMFNYTPTQHVISGQTRNLMPPIYIPNRTLTAGTAFLATATYEAPTVDTGSVKNFVMFSVERPIQVSRVYIQQGSAHALDVAPNYMQYEYGIYTAVPIPIYADMATVALYPGGGTTIGLTGDTYDNEYRRIRARWPGQRKWVSPVYDTSTAVSTWPAVSARLEGSTATNVVLSWDANFILQPGVYFLARHAYRYGTGGSIPATTGIASSNSAAQYNVEGGHALRMFPYFVGDSSNYDELATFNFGTAQSIRGGHITAFSLVCPAGAFTTLSEEYASVMSTNGITPVLDVDSAVMTSNAPTAYAGTFVDTPGLYTDPGDTVSVSVRSLLLGGIAFAGTFFGNPADNW
jgi:hypothetical protein